MVITCIDVDMQDCMLLCYHHCLVALQLCDQGVILPSDS